MTDELNWKHYDCPHCYASFKLNWEYSDQEPDNIFCPNCGEKAELESLDFDTVDFDDEDLWDE